MTAVPRRPLYALLLYPFEICLSLGLALLAIGSFVQGWTFSQTVDRELGLIVAGVWQAGLLLGCTLIFAGLLLRPRAARSPNREANLVRLRGVESAGCIGMGMAMWTYALILGNFVGNHSVFVLGVHFLLGMAFFLRVVALVKTDKLVLDSFRALNA